MTRIRDNDYTVRTVSTWQKIAGSAFQINVSSSLGLKGLSTHMEDEPHPGYKARIKSGEVILGRLLKRTSERIVQSGAIDYLEKYQGTDWGIHISGDLAAYIEPTISYDWSGPEGLFSSDVDLALVLAYAKIRNDSIMSGEIMADIGQSLSMLRRPFGGTVKLLGKAFRQAAKSYRKTAASVAKANAGAWLEYRYGIMPLLLDSKQALKMYAQAERRLQRARKVVRQSRGFSSVQDVGFAGKGIASPLAITVSGSLRNSLKGRTEAGVIYALSGRTQAVSLSEDLRLGVDSAASTAWEIVPLSFVADWFVKVGPWLEAVNLPPSVSVLGNWVTQVSDHNLDLQVTAVSSNYGGPRFGTGGGSSRNVNTVYRRYNLLLPPYPPIDFRLPSILHATDALALLTGSIIGLCGKLAH